MLKQLDAWWVAWWKDNSKACAMRSDINVTIIDRTLFNSWLEFDDIRAAYLIATYDTTRVLLLVLLQIIVRNVNDHDRSDLAVSAYDMLQRKADSAYQPLCGLTSDIRMISLEICQILDHCSRISDQQYSFSFSCMIALDTAYSCLGPASREAKWILSKIPTPAPPSARSTNSLLPISMLPSCQLFQDAKRDLLITHQQ